MAYPLDEVGKVTYQAGHLRLSSFVYISRRRAHPLHSCKCFAMMVPVPAAEPEVKEDVILCRGATVAYAIAGMFPECVVGGPLAEIVREDVPLSRTTCIASGARGGQTPEELRATDSFLEGVGIYR